ncbi:hypothetical protein D3C77_482710 [compost metagenome]
MQFSQQGQLVDLGQRPIDALVVQNTHGRRSRLTLFLCAVPVASRSACYERYVELCTPAVYRLLNWYDQFVRIDTPSIVAMSLTNKGVASYIGKPVIELLKLVLPVARGA